MSQRRSHRSAKPALRRLMSRSDRIKSWIEKNMSSVVQSGRMSAPRLSSQGDLLAVPAPWGRRRGRTSVSASGSAGASSPSGSACSWTSDSSRRETPGGRAPRELRFRGEAGLTLVGRLGASTLSTGICDLAGTRLAHSSEPADVARRPGPVLAPVQQGTHRRTGPRSSKNDPQERPESQNCHGTTEPSRFSRRRTCRPPRRGAIHWRSSC